MRADGIAGRRAKPVKAWAVVGAMFLALEAYVLSAWIVSGDATPTPAGPTPMPGWMSNLAVVVQAGSVIAALFVVYAFLVRPLMRDRRLSSDGLLVLVFASVYWQDPLMSYAQHQLTYNAVFVNLGSWAPHLPGWVAPNANLVPEPLLLIGPSYVWWGLGFVALGNMVMARVQARRPELSKGGLIAVAYIFYSATVLALECAMMRLGIWSFPSGIASVTLWHGHYYQLPLYEIVLAGAWWAALGCLRYFKDDRGHTIVERGIDQVSAPQNQKNALRFLALAGVANLIFLIYNLTYVFIGGLHADAWPADIQNRSYLTNGLCGRGTSYACPGPDVPIPRPGSIHLGPDGRLVS